MTAAVEVKALDAGYQGVRVVRGLDLSVDDGEVIALLGPNGAGKTTTLLTVCGLLPPLGGEIRLCGQPMKGHDPARAARLGVALVPEDRALFTSLTARENLRLALHRRRHRTRFDEAIDRFPELVPLLDRSAGLLSGGEQQMLALARALACHPRVLVVDEMSLGLGPIIVQRLVPMLREIADTEGTAILFVEQYVDLALGIADRAVVMQHGEVVLQGDARDLVEKRELIQTSYMGS